jgi:hypothetical protein
MPGRAAGSVFKPKLPRVRGRNSKILHCRSTKKRCGCRPKIKGFRIYRGKDHATIRPGRARSFRAARVSAGPDRAVRRKIQGIIRGLRAELHVRARARRHVRFWLCSRQGCASRPGCRPVNCTARPGYIARNPARCDSLHCRRFLGGEYRNRTDLHGFAIRCVTSPPTRRRRCASLARPRRPCKTALRNRAPLPHRPELPMLGAKRGHHAHQTSL